MSPEASQHGGGDEIKESPKFGPYDDEKPKKSGKKCRTEVRRDLAVILEETPREGGQYKHKKEKKKKKRKHQQGLQHDEQPKQHVQSAHTEHSYLAQQTISDDEQVKKSLRSLETRIKDLKDDQEQEWTAESDVVQDLCPAKSHKEEGAQRKSMANAFNSSSLYGASEMSYITTDFKLNNAGPSVMQQWPSKQIQRMSSTTNRDKWETLIEMDAPKRQRAIHGESDPPVAGPSRDLEDGREARRNDSGRAHELPAMYLQSMGTDSLVAQDAAPAFRQDVARFELEHETESTNGHEYDQVTRENRMFILDYYRLVNDTKAALELSEYDKRQLGAKANHARRAGYGDESTSMVAVDGTGEWLQDEENSSSLNVSQSSDASVAGSTSRRSRHWPPFETPGAIQMDGRALGAPVRETSRPGGDDDADDAYDASPTAQSTAPVVYTEKLFFVSWAKEHLISRRAFVILALVIVAVIASVLAVQFTGKDDSTSGLQEDPPTSAPTFISNVLVQELEGVSGSEALSEPGSPQRRAIGWLSSIDESGIEATDSRLVQRYVLVVLYYATSGEEWLDRDNWLDPSLHECQWGSTITCKTDPSNLQIVIGLELSTHGLKGELPPEIGYLDQIERFIMSRNSLNGTLPASIFNMTRLAVLDLHGNDFTGSLPSTISNAPFIEHLDLSMNFFGGKIPEALYDLSILRKLDVSVNQITGPLASEIGKLGVLTEFNVRSNLITGIIPDAFDLLPNLGVISLDNNLLSGNIPEFSGVFVQHLEVTVAHNLLTGSIPDLPSGGLAAPGGVSSESYRLQKVDISNNRLVGTISFYIGLIPSIRYFDFSNNQFEGTFPTGVDMWRSIEYLAASNCQLTGTAPTAFPPSLSHYDFHGNNILGGFPVELTAINLEYLSLSYNDLGGQIPPQLGSMERLEALDLYACGLTGTIPSLANMTSLARIGLAENSLGGPLSTDIGSLSTLTELNVHSNQLTGSIPTELGNLSNLVVFDIRENFLTGTLPSELGNMMDLDEFLVAGNHLEASVPEGVCQVVDDLRQVDVGCQLECSCCLDETGLCT